MEIPYHSCRACDVITPNFERLLRCRTCAVRENYLKSPLKRERNRLARIHAKIEPTSCSDEGQVPQMSAFEYHYAGQVTFHPNTDI